MKKNILIAPILSLLPFASLMAVEGYINYNGRAITGEDRAAKAIEYDQKKAAFGNFSVHHANERSLFVFDGADVATDNQGYSFSGRNFGSLKYNIKYNETYHTSSVNNVTPYSGFGGSQYVLGHPVGTTASATGVATINDAAAKTWNRFEYHTEISDIAASATYKFQTPYFVKLSANRRTKEGLRPVGLIGFTGTGGTRWNMEIPETIDENTVNATVEAGYQGEKLSSSLYTMVSKYDPKSMFLEIQDFRVTTVQPEYNKMSTSPESDLFKIGNKGTFHGLPAESVVSWDVNYSKTSNTVPLVMNTYNYLGTGIVDSTWLCGSEACTEFKGEIETLFAKVAVKSKLTDSLSSKVYAKYYVKDNNSTRLSVQSTGANVQGTASVLTNEVFDYNKSNLGANLDYKFTDKTKLETNLDYLIVNRSERFDIDQNKDISASFKLKSAFNPGLMAFYPHLKYKYLNRTTNFTGQNFANVGPDSGNVNVLRHYTRRFDVNDKDMHEVSTGVDSSITEDLSVGLEASYAVNQYKKVILGRKNDDLVMAGANVTYSLPDWFTLSAFAQMEMANELTINRTCSTQCNPIMGSNSSSNYNWSQMAQDDIFTYGVDLLVPVIDEKLDVKAAFFRQKSNGSTDFDADSTARGPVPGVNEDDFTKNQYSIESDYRINGSFSVAGGYGYTRFKFNDDAFKDYKFAATNNTFNSYFSGYYTDREYSVNEFWLGGTYRF